MTMLPVAVLTLCLSSAVLSAPSLDPQLDQHWNLWKSWHSKNYHQREEGWRRMVWEKNLKKIELHNLEHSMGKHSYRLGMNHFGDMTHEEFKQIMNGYKHKAERKFKGSLFLEPNFLEAPRSVDWREKGYVTPVKDQVRRRLPLFLFPQFLLLMFQMEINQSGSSLRNTAALDPDHPYQPLLAPTCVQTAPGGFLGIYYEKECSSEELDHGVLAVGYGFQGEDVDGKKFWIVKNSWSENWGDKGYIYMAKDRKNHCGIATAASYPLV
uniref:Cystein proteinase inhibitor protein salarin n=1 Tax=Fundulus heteroclitus TaxID=8078 RepID=A0A3Q2R1L2_FUNHE